MIVNFLYSIICCPDRWRSAYQLRNSNSEICFYEYWKWPLTL